MTKLADLENDIADFKAATGERLDQLDAVVDAIRADLRAAATLADQRHADNNERHNEMMALLLRLAPSTSLSAPPPPPPSSAVQVTPHTTLPPPSGGQLLGSLPLTAGVSQPLVFSSSMLFDEYGFPLPNVEPQVTMSEAHSSVTDGYYVPPHSVPFSRPVYSSPGPSFRPFGMGSTENKVWFPGADYRLRKLKMPIFEGEDVYGWVYRLERFFDIQGLGTTGEKLRAAVLCMEGQALSWYRWTERRTLFRTWEELKLAMLDRFQPSQQGSLYEQFLNIRQEGSVRDYVSLFESLAAQLEGMSEQVLEGTFLKGLNSELRASVRVLHPVGLGHLIKLAIIVDESKMGSNGEQLKQFTGASEHLRTTTATPPVSVAPPVVPSFADATKPPFRRMTDTEYFDKKAKGLCFRCDGKFGPGHRCPDKTLRVMLVQEGVENSEGEEEPGGKHAHTD